MIAMSWCRVNRAGKRHSITSKIFLIFMVYGAFNALLDLIVNQLSGDYPEELNYWQGSVRPHYEDDVETATFCEHKELNDLINGTALSHHQSRDNDNDSNVDYNKSLNDAASSWISLLSTTSEHYLAAKIIKARRWWLGGALWTQVEAIRLVRLDAPNIVEVGQPIRLRCIYETKGDKLQSLSWYKNGHEFYRYQPFERRQPVLAFNYTGVTVDLSKSKNSTVFLTNTTIETSGRYKCEATATTFQEVNLETYLAVVPSASDVASRRVSIELILGLIAALSSLMLIM